MSQARELFKKYINNQCSEDELKNFLQLIRENENQDILKQLINENLTGGVDEDTDHADLDDKVHHIFDKLRSKIEQEDQVVPRYRTLRVWSSAAAAVLFILGIGIYFFKSDSTTSVHQVTKKNATVVVEEKLVTKSEIKPGGNKAILTLANGEDIVLADAGDGLLINQGATQISKTKDGELVYNVGEEKQFVAPQMNKIKIPKGGQYAITLPDGTKVWINADSELKFPTYFLGAERRVELKGEAYFEVAKNKDMPFKVVSGNQIVEVLGTHFNVNSYKNEGKIVTTLLEGSVRVYKPSTHQSALLKPGEQAITNNEIAVKEASVEQVIAWKDGLMSFKDADIEDIMRQLVRWYDIEVEFAGVIPKRLFTGKVSRQANLSEILSLLEKSHIHFKTEGKTITVMP